MGNLHSLKSLRLIEGIGECLQPTDVFKWLDPFMSTLVSTSVKASIPDKARIHLLDAAAATSNEINIALDRRLDDWIKHHEKGEAPELSELVRELKKDIVAQRFPF